MQLILVPFVISILMSLCWGIFHYFTASDLVYLKQDEGLLVVVITIIGIGYVLFASSVDGIVWSEWKGMLSAIAIHDKKEFIRLKDQRMSPHVKALMFVFSFLLLVPLFFLTVYNTFVIGAFSIFAVMFILTAHWLIVRDLDDYFSGVWKIDVNSLPEDWRKELKV